MPLSPEFYRGNRQKIQKRLQPGEVFVHGAHRRLQKSADETFFSQDRDFLYLSGIDEPDWILVITTDREFLIAPQLTRVERLFDGGLSFEEATALSGGAQVFDNKPGWHELDALLKSATEVQLVLREDRLWFRTHANPSLSTLLRRVRARTTSPVVSVHPQIHAARAIKQPEEIAAIEKAIEITGQALEDVRQKFQNYQAEYEIAADLTAGFMRRQSRGHAFTPIVASGQNANTVHYIANNQLLTKDATVIIDVGAEWRGYGADISRTLIWGEASARAKDVHAAVRTAQERIIKALKPGLTFKEYYQQEMTICADEMARIGLFTEKTTENVRRFYPYGGHMLGLDIHDVSSGKKAFEPGMVLTVEPGIHLHDEGIGVRIEDDILITEDGSRNLSKHISHDL